MYEQEGWIPGVEVCVCDADEAVGDVEDEAGHGCFLFFRIPFCLRFRPLFLFRFFSDRSFFAFFLFASSRKERVARM